MFRLALPHVLAFVLSAAAVPAAASAESAEPGAKELIEAGDEEWTAVSDRIAARGLSAVPGLLESLDAAGDRRGRIERTLAKLKGSEEGFDLPKELADRASGTKAPEGPRRISRPCISDDGRRIAVSVACGRDGGARTVVVLDAAAGSVVSLLQGECPSLSSDGRTLAYLRPRGDDVTFFVKFDTRAAAVHFPDRSLGYVLDRSSAADNSDISMSSCGTRAAYRERTECVVMPVREDASAILRTQGSMPSLSPDGDWLARIDGSGRIALCGTDGSRQAIFPVPAGFEVSRLSCLPGGEGAAFILKGAGGAAVYGWNLRSASWGRLDQASPSPDLCVSARGQILWTCGGLLLRQRIESATRRLAARADSAGISPAGTFAAYAKGESIRRIFLGVASG